MRPDPARIGRVDALILSHAHKDHCGALDLLDRIGRPDVCATRSVLDRIDAPRKRILPTQGSSEVCGIPVATGRAGHAIGGIWIRFDLKGGLLYMGDHSAESRVLGFDEPPPSRTLILDGSYGNNNEPRSAQAKELLAAASSRPVHFPVPADGRGVEIALSLHEAGVAVALDDAVRCMLVRLSGVDRDFAEPAAADSAATLAQSAPAAIANFAGAMVTSDGMGDAGMSARLIEASAGRALPHIIFTGHLYENTRGRALVDSGRARFRRWNVHPTLSQNAALVRSVQARKVLPAFGNAEYRAAWQKAFAPAEVVVEVAVEL
jgi:Cft2 family RNA processing exonuclease